MRVRLGPLDGVGAVERFVEHQHLWFGDQDGGHLGPLAHALAVARGSGRSAAPCKSTAAMAASARSIGHAGQDGCVLDVAPPGQEPVDGILLRHEGQVPVDLRIAAGIEPQTRTAPSEGASSPVTMRSKVVFPAPFGPEDAGDPGAEGARHVGDRHLLAEPLGDGCHLDGGFRDEWRGWRS